MFEKSERRLGLEEVIRESHSGAIKETIKWMIFNTYNSLMFNAHVWPLSKPIEEDCGVRGMYNLLVKQKLSPEVYRGIQKLKSSQSYHEGYRQLLELEEEEGFPAMKYRASQLDKLIPHLPETKGYNVFAGNDFYWARLFALTVFEDIAYDKEWDMHMWWQPEMYQRDSIDLVLTTLKKAGVLDDASDIRLIAGDSEITRGDNDFDRTDWTLVVAGGHSVIPFLDKRYKEGLNYGAVVIADPADRHEKLLSSMEQRGYECTFYDQGEVYSVPFAISTGHNFVFIKNS